MATSVLADRCRARPRMPPRARLVHAARRAPSSPWRTMRRDSATVSSPSCVGASTGTWMCGRSSVEAAECAPSSRGVQVEVDAHRREIAGDSTVAGDNGALVAAVLYRLLQRERIRRAAVLVDHLVGMACSSGAASVVFVRRSFVGSSWLPGRTPASSCSRSSELMAAAVVGTAGGGGADCQWR